MDNDIVLNRPEPITSEIEVVPFTKRMVLQDAVDDLVEGHYVLIRDFFSTGLLVLNELKKHVRQHHPDESYQGQRASRAVFRKLSNRLLMRVKDNRLMVRKAPEIGWFSILYPDLDEFLIPFAQAQGLNSAWQWFQKGISIPVLKDRIFPFYGTYFPTRFEHLQIFDQWLNEYGGSKASAIDVGVGCGVMTYQLLNHGFAKICATDSNPNAIYGMKEALAKKGITSEVELFFGDLFAHCDLQTDLIVFNPPWLPLANDNEGIDKAMYYDQDLFPRFFAEAAKHLEPEGKLVLLFSNLAQVTHLTKTNPIEEELESGGRFQKDLLVKSKVNAASNKTRRNQTWREDEFVELWVLKLI
ncbi:MAG: methyltransferase [Opitutaceae bacterium]|nr:methyltransferase [Opitutaceae bacterium]